MTVATVIKQWVEEGKVKWELQIWNYRDVVYNERLDTHQMNAISPILGKLRDIGVLTVEQKQVVERNK